MLSVSARNTTEFAKSITEPIVLLYLGFPTPIRISTRGPITWAGSTWEQTYLDLGGIEYDDLGANRAVVRVSPDYRDSILQNSFFNIRCSLYMLWGQPTFALDDGIKIIEGWGESADINRDFIDINIVSTNARVGVTPRAFYEHQNIQPAGTKITVRQKTITIDRAEFI